MRRRLIAVTLLSLLTAPQARADGCKFATDGRMVPEREQRAFVTWADGVETLHVAALSDATSEGSVWVVPIRAAAGAVRGEPVELFPTVVYYETLRGSSRAATPCLRRARGGARLRRVAHPVSHQRVRRRGRQERCRRPGLTCEYVYGDVESRVLGQAFATDKPPGGRSRLS